MTRDTAENRLRLSKAMKRLEPFLRDAEENRLFGIAPVSASVFGDKQAEKLRGLLIEAMDAGADPKSFPLSLMRKAGLED